MLHITNGEGVFVVTRGAYESIYKKQGFKIVNKSDGEIESKESNEPEPLSEAKDDESFASELEKKPLASWSKDEVKRYAAVYGLDISATKNVNQAKGVIRKFMDEQVSE